MIGTELCLYNNLTNREWHQVHTILPIFRTFCQIVWNVEYDVLITQIVWHNGTCLIFVYASLVAITALSIMTSAHATFQVRLYYRYTRSVKEETSKTGHS